MLTTAGQVSQFSVCLAFVANVNHWWYNNPNHRSHFSWPDCYLVAGIVSVWPGMWSVCELSPVWRVAAPALVWYYRPTTHLPRPRRKYRTAGPEILHLEPCMLLPGWGGGIEKATLKWNITRFHNKDRIYTTSMEKMYWNGKLLPMLYQIAL